MTCDEYQNRILAGEANPLTPAEQAAAQAHIADCIDCRTLAEKFVRLDQALTRSVKAPQLSLTFEARLRQRIQAQSAVMSMDQREKRKRQLQSEYEMCLAELPFRLPNFSPLPEYCASGAAIALAGLILYQSFHAPLPNMLSWWLSGALVVAGLALAFPRRLRQIWFVL